MPNYAFALTGGPHQIEYTSYEEPGATDMVNLLTGDFTYNLPILDIPGPEGSFSLPLSYHAGIGLEQEASWVGLGWTMNPGAIVRNINEFPDDASGELHSVNVQDMNVIKGWASNLGLVQFGWNNQDGHYGSVNLFDLVTASWSGGNLQSVGVAGLTVSADGVSFNPVTFIMSVVTVATWGATAQARAAWIAKVEGARKSLSLGVTMAIDAGMSVAIGAAMGAATPNAPSNGVWKHTKVEKRKWFHKEYKIWLDHTRTEDMYGILYMGTPNIYTNYSPGSNGISINLVNGGTTETMSQFVKSSNKGSASDINYHIDANKEYYEVNNPAVLAYDDYQVYGVGVSGAISPYRLDVGSVSMPREMTSNHDRLAPVKFQDYKVPFVYEGVPANNYFHHVGSSTSVSSPTPYFGASYSLGSSNVQTNNSLTYNLNDVVLKNQRIRSDVNSTKKIPNGNHVEWLSNSEIANSVTYPSSFLDFLPGGGTASDRYLFRSNFSLGSISVPLTYYTSMQSFSNVIPVSSEIFELLNLGDRIDLYVHVYNSLEERELAEGGAFLEMTNLTVQSKSQSGFTITLSPHGYFTSYNGMWADLQVNYFKSPQLGKAIGGYVITAQDGTNYHYALPVYDYDVRTEVFDATNELKKSVMTRKQAFANTWLLTAITYADYIDRNNNGLADDGDWGGWIKFDYGKHEDQYQWRSPWQGTKMDPEEKSKSYSQGTKQLYYLNSIETRSHVALFLKSVRSDGRSKNGKSPLKLDEIVLLDKEYYKKLTRPVGSGGFGMPSFSNQITNVCLSSHFVGTGVRDFVNSNAHKRILFTYATSGNELCPGTPNSLSGGKLTLVRLTSLGRGSDTRLVPDYKFEYGYNPSYGEHLWDGWGFYNPAGTSAGNTHKASQDNLHGTAWSLTKITTPLGSEIEITYERDDYASVSGGTIPSTTTYTSDTNLSDGLVNSFTPNTQIATGDRVYVSVKEEYYCAPYPGSICDDPYTGQTFPCPEELYFQILGSSWGTVQGNQVLLDAPITYTTGIYTCQYGVGSGGSGIVIGIEKKQVRGGGLRVASIAMLDEFGIENKVLYKYRTQSGGSSGVISKQNPYMKHGTYFFENRPEYPGTPVMYGRVEVLNGELSNESDYHTKTVYEFETPHQNMVTQNTTYNSTIVPKTLIRNKAIIVRDYITMHHHILENHTAKIGQLKSIKIFDRLNQLKSSSEMVYTSQIVNDAAVNHQGVYTQGVLMVDRIKNGSFEWYHKFNRTTVLRYAYTLKEVINTKDGNTSKSENTKWDFITGNVLEKIETSPLGLKVKSVTVPAYKQTPYAEFESKALSISNKNMLSQVAAEYTYLLDNNGNEVGLLGASVQTWKKDWNNYRIYTDGTYTQGLEGDPIWRKSASYVWRGDYSRLRPDGSQTFSASDKFNFNSVGSNPGWEYVGEPLRYDHYSMTLESKDRNNIYASSKMGYDNKIKILSASNAEYTEVAFSSAEDYDAVTGHFGGEVALKSSGGNATVIKKSGGGDSHTGDCAIQLSSGYGFVYKPTGLKPNKKYRASVWTKSTNGRIYYKLNGGSEVVSPAPTTTTKAGNWYQINFEIPIGSSFSSLEVGVKSTSGTVQFDDFRFQPVDASMICYVYNPLSYELSPANLEYSEYVLDNDNLYTRYQYNARGQLYRTFRESIKYNGEKLVSESTSDYRRFYVNQ